MFSLGSTEKRWTERSSQYAFPLHNMGHIVSAENKIFIAVNSLVQSTSLVQFRSAWFQLWQIGWSKGIRGQKRMLEVLTTSNVGDELLTELFHLHTSLALKLCVIGVAWWPPSALAQTQTSVDVVCLNFIFSRCFSASWMSFFLYDSGGQRVVGQCPTPLHPNFPDNMVFGMSKIIHFWCLGE